MQSKVTKKQVFISEDYGSFQAKFMAGELEITPNHPNHFIDRSGVYIWSLEYNNKQLIYYIGRTKDFGKHIQQWANSYKKGTGYINNPGKLKNGNRDMLFPCDICPMSRDTLKISSNEFKKTIWPKTFLPRWENNHKNIKQKLCDMLNLFRIYYVPLEDDRERKLLKSSLGLSLFNSDEYFISHFMNEIDWLTLAKDDIELENNSNQTLIFEIKNNDKFYGLPKEIASPINYLTLKKSIYFEELRQLFISLKSPGIK